MHFERDDAALKRWNNGSCGFFNLRLTPPSSEKDYKFQSSTRFS